MLELLKRVVDENTRAPWRERKRDGGQLSYVKLFKELIRMYGVNNEVQKRQEWLSLSYRPAGAWNRGD